jgi:eukaryotic translation initiation factor 2C
MFRPAEIPNWVVLIYEHEQRFSQQAASQVITDLVRACEAVGWVIHGILTTASRTKFLTGIITNPLPAVLKWESGQGNVGHVRHDTAYLTLLVTSPQQLRAACDECQEITKAPPTLIAVILPDGGTDIYTAVKQ